MENDPHSLVGPSPEECAAVVERLNAVKQEISALSQRLGLNPQVWSLHENDSLLLVLIVRSLLPFLCSCWPLFALFALVGPWRHTATLGGGEQDQASCTGAHLL